MTNNEPKEKERRFDGGAELDTHNGSGGAGVCRVICMIFSFLTPDSKYVLCSLTYNYRRYTQYLRGK